MGLKLYKSRIWFLGTEKQPASSDLIDRWCSVRNPTLKQANHFSKKYGIQIKFRPFVLKVTRKVKKQLSKEWPMV